jgi:hypothetical protein
MKTPGVLNTDRHTNGQTPTPTEGCRKRVKLATAVFQREQRELCNHVIG